MKRKEIRINLNGPKTRAFFDSTSRGRTLLYVEIIENGKIARAWVDVSRFYEGVNPKLIVTVRKSDGQDKSVEHLMPWMEDNRTPEHH